MFKTEKSDSFISILQTDVGRTTFSTHINTMRREICINKLPSITVDVLVKTK